jgi:MinD-like ATPase involved in chromosome partitioning or flagellar assembly
MYCLLCHEKISRIRHWRTKSEFCCDEHAAIHRRQTLERLVGHVSPSSEGNEERLAALGKPAAVHEEESDAPPLPLGAVEAEEPLNFGEETDGGTDTAREASTEVEFSFRAERLQTSEEAEEEGSVSAEDPSRETDFDAEEEPPTDEADDDRRYFEGASVQRDEPFPVEIQAAEVEETGDEEDLGLDAGEPIEPATAAAVSNPAQLLDPVGTDAAGDLLVLQASVEDEILPVSGLEDSLSETAEDLAQAIFERNRAKSASEQAAKESESEEHASTVTSQAATQANAETVAAADSGKSPAAKTETSKTTATASAPQAKSAAALSKESRPGAKGFGLRPVRTWDPSKGRVYGGKKRAGGRQGAGPTGNAESLNQLAEGLGDRTKTRSTRLGSEIRREDGRKPVMVCFLPVQGGNGASTVSLHVAEAISHHLNERVLLADFDFHSGTLAFRLGLKPVHTLGDVFEWSQNKDQLWESVVCRWKKLDVLVAPPSNSSIHPHGLDKLPDIFGSALERYPYVIVDHPDAIYSSSRHILTMSDLVYLVCTPEITSLHLARRKVQQIRAMGVASERLRLIVNRAGSWGSLGVQDVGKIVGVPVSWALNNDYAALRDAVWNGGLVQDGSELAKQLRELGWSVMGVDAPVVAESASSVEVGSTVG